MTKPGRIALIDMDGTVADFDGAMKESFDRLSPPDYASYDILSERYGRDRWPDYLWNRKDLIQRQPGWWRNLPRLDVGFEIIDVLQEFDFDFHIATQGPSSKPLAWAEKVEWVREHMPYADVHVTEKKSLLYGKVLVDDWPPFAWEWLHHRPRGLVIMPAHHYNKDFRNPEQVLRYESGMQDQLRERITELLRV